MNHQVTLQMSRPLVSGRADRAEVGSRLSFCTVPVSQALQLPRLEVCNPMVLEHVPTAKNVNRAGAYIFTCVSTNN